MASSKIGGAAIAKRRKTNDNKRGVAGNITKRSIAVKDQVISHKKRRPREEDEEVESISSVESTRDNMDSDHGEGSLSSAASEASDEEGLIEKHLAEERLANERRRQAAQEYLASLKDSQALSGKLTLGNERKEEPADEEEDEIDAAEIDRQNIAARLKQDILQAKGKVFKRVAEEVYSGIKNHLKESHGVFLKMNSVPTCVAIFGNRVYAGSKGGDIQEWILSENSSASKGKVYPHGKGHKGHTLCLVISADGKYLVSGGRDSLICVWDRESGDLLGSLKQHRGPITGLAFQMGSHTLFSCSTDRTIKLWNIADLAYVDTLFGHQDEVLSIDSLALERCLTVGARDRTVRLWKVPEESQLVFRGVDNAGGSIDAISFIDGEHFISGSDSGAISIWGTHKKKPLLTIYNPNNLEEEAGEFSSAVTAIHSLRLTDFFITAHANGLLNFWSVDTEGYRVVKRMAFVELSGCINALCLNGEGTLIAVAQGREGRLGRWSVDKSAKNGIVIMSLIDKTN